MKQIKRQLLTLAAYAVMVLASFGIGFASGHWLGYKQGYQDGPILPKPGEIPGWLVQPPKRD